jgi:hypothetical protein
MSKTMHKNKKIPWRESLGFTLLVWFLIISITPILIFEYYSYKDRVEELESHYKSELKTMSLSQRTFINSWFKYRESDIYLWSQLQNNLTLFSSIQSEFKKSRNINELLQSYEYAVILGKYERDLIHIITEYDYILDFLFIDLEGNILYSLQKDDILGENVKNESYSSSRLALGFSKTTSASKTFSI